MADPRGASGWTTVGQANLAFRGTQAWNADQEIQERNVIAAWDRDDCWPSVDKPLFEGPEAKRFDSRLIRLGDLGNGAFGIVEKVTHGSICLARKRIKRRRGFTIDDLRQEALTMRKLDHRHVVRLVATYAPRSHELCLLIWPAAACNLSTLLEDVENIRIGEGDRVDILERLHALDLTDLSAIEPASTPQCFDSAAKCPLEYLRHVVGCTARAMAHCHSNNVRHLDIKPSNILLNAGRVYLADFGISRDVSGQDHTTTEGAPGTEKWRAPELYAENGSSMQFSDIYSLGLVYLNIATVLYNARLTSFDDALRYPRRDSRLEQLKAREEQLQKHLENLTAHALVTPPFMFTYDGQETVRPRPLVRLIAQMIAPFPQNRLAAHKLDDKLSMLGGIHQIYHGECCKRPISWVEDKWDKKFAAMAELRDENARQARKIKDFEGRDVQYESRLAGERRKEALLQEKLREMKEKCSALEEENSALKNSGRRRASMMTTRSRNNSLGFGGYPLNKKQSTPTTPQTRPSIQQKSLSSQRNCSTSIPASPSPRTSLNDLTPRRSPSTTSLLGSRLPRRTGTPGMNREQGSTDSSKGSSVFSRAATSGTATSTPIMDACESPEEVTDDKTATPASRRTSEASSETPERMAKVPSLVSMKSWADVARKRDQTRLGTKK